MSQKYEFIIKPNNCNLAVYFIQALTNCILKQEECDLLFNSNKKHCEGNHYYISIQKAIYNKVLSNNDEHPGPEEYQSFLERIRAEKPDAKFIFDFDAIENYRLPDMKLLFRGLMQNILKLRSHFPTSNIQLFIKKEFLELPGVTNFTDCTKLLYTPGLIVVR